MNDSSQSKDEMMTRCAAVIVASKPLVHQDTAEAYLPAMLSIGDVTYIESLIIRLKLAGAMPSSWSQRFGNDLLERHLAKWASFASTIRSGRKRRSAKTRCRVLTIEKRMLRAERLDSDATCAER